MFPNISSPCISRRLVCSLSKRRVHVSIQTRASDCQRLQDYYAARSVYLKDIQRSVTHQVQHCASSLNVSSAILSGRNSNTLSSNVHLHNLVQYAQGNYLNLKHHSIQNAQLNTPGALRNFSTSCHNCVVSKAGTQICSSEVSSDPSTGSGQLEEERKTLELTEALLAQERWALARAITLVEATHKKGKQQAQVMLRSVLDHLRMKQAENNGIPPSFRIGLTGPPGAGKSTFIEALGKKLTAEGHRVAVLAVDPSSSITGGSLLGDKTRMTELSRDPKAYIRASPSSGTLGGVARNTNDTILLCEAAGYDIVLVETIGVGQSEYVVADMVDMLVLLIPPAGGDELQGLKKGIVERADFILINKADGELLIPARRMRAEYTSAVKLMYKRSPLWSTKVKQVSAKTGDGLRKAWDTMAEYRTIMQNARELTKKRALQRRVWMWQHIQDRMMETFQESKELVPHVQRWEEEVMFGRCTSGIAADELLKRFSELQKKL